MKIFSLQVQIVVLSSFLLLNTSFMFSSQTPLDTVRKANKEILNVFIFNKNIDKRHELLIRRIVNNSINIPVISGRIINRFCDKISKSQCEYFDRVFQDFLIVSILGKLHRHHAVHFKYLQEKIDRNIAVVKAAVTYKNETVDVEYRLENFEGHWLIVNSIVDDIDMIENYQKQFEKLFLRYPFDKIISRLLNKISRYENKYGK